MATKNNGAPVFMLAEVMALQLIKDCPPAPEKMALLGTVKKQRNISHARLVTAKGALEWHQNQAADALARGESYDLEKHKKAVENAEADFALYVVAEQRAQAAADEAVKTAKIEIRGVQLAAAVEYVGKLSQQLTAAAETNENLCALWEHSVTLLGSRDAIPQLHFVPLLNATSTFDTLFELWKRTVERFLADVEAVDEKQAAAKPEAQPTAAEFAVVE